MRSIAVRAPRSPNPATRSILICCAAWRSRDRTRSGPWTSPTSRWRTASSISPWCWTGRHVVFCRGGCRSRWRPLSASRPWRMRWLVMAGRKSSTPTRDRSSRALRSPVCLPATASPSAWTAKGPGGTTYSLSGCGKASNTRRSICELTKPSPRREIQSAGISTFTTDDDRIRALTTAPRIKPTSIFHRSARRPNPGRGSTYRRGIFVQTTGTSSHFGHGLCFFLIPETPESALDRACEIARREFAVGEKEENDDRDLRDHEAGGRQVEHCHVTVAVQLQHADGHREVRLRIEEYQPEDEFLPDGDEVERKAHHDSRHRQRQDHFPEHLKVGRSFEEGRLFDLQRDGRHEAAQNEDLGWHSISGVDDDKADPGVEKAQGSERVIERDQHGLLRQHQPGQDDSEDEFLARDVKAGQCKGRHQRRDHGQRRAGRRIEEAVREKSAKPKSIPDRDVWRECRLRRQSERPGQEGVIGLYRGYDDEDDRTEPNEDQRGEQHQPDELAGDKAPLTHHECDIRHRRPPSSASSSRKWP